MEILFNSYCIKYNEENHIEGSYRIKDFKGKFKNNGSKIEGEKALSLLYSDRYINDIKKDFLNQKYIAEVNTNQNTYDAACISVDLAIKAATKNAFAITRPPGHHASSSNAEGFCFFNNIALATQKLLNQKKKVCIIDIDGHHGNGTEKIFKNNPNVLFCSLHQENIYPYSGYLEEDKALNFPLTANSGDDILINTIKLFLEKIEDFDPDNIGISAGFDGYHKDALLLLNYTNRGYYEIGKLISSLNKKVFCCLEGGYHNNILECTKELINGLESQKYSGKEKLSKSNKEILNIYKEKQILFRKIHTLTNP